VVYDVKRYMCHKVRLVAGGDMDEVPEDITASVSSLHGMQILILVAELNGTHLCAGDIGKVYL